VGWTWEDRIDRVDLSQQAMLSWEGRPGRASSTHNRSGSGPSEVFAADGEAIKENCEVRTRRGGAVMRIGCVGVERARLHPAPHFRRPNLSPASRKRSEPQRRGPASGRAEKGRGKK